MAYITLNKHKLIYNYTYLNQIFKKKNIEWTIVSKLLCGNELYLKILINLGIKRLCDSRVSNLKAIKKINPQVETVYIKPPPSHSIPDIIRYADISFNTEYQTLRQLSCEAARQRKKHQVVIMIELGELREGVLCSEIISFYGKAFRLPNIQIIGIGTNFTCLSGVLPDYDKLNRLVRYQKLLVEKFNHPLPWISGGASVTLPLLLDNQLPLEINHFRIGETLFFGTNVYDNSSWAKMYHDVITLHAEIIELNKKPISPDGKLGSNLEGNTMEVSSVDRGKTSWRAIVDIGLLDVEYIHLEPIDEHLECAGASSDMLIVDLKDNIRDYKPGDYIEFKLDYMATLRLMNSKYIDKRVKENHQMTLSLEPKDTVN